MATVREIKERLRVFGVAPGKRRKSELLDLLRAEEEKVTAKEDLQFKERGAANKAICDFMNRDPDSFSDIVRGLHVFGRKILRQEALVRGVIDFA